jgi:hypothetical protein
MDRRQFLHGTLGAALTGPFVAATPLAAQAPAAGPSRPPAPPLPIPRKLVLDANARSLQWIKSADDVAQAAIEMVCGGVCPTVAAAPAHIDSTRVAEQLPDFVKRVRAHGLRVTQIRLPTVRNATDPHAETIVATAAQQGITHYSIGSFTYDLAKPLRPQLDAIKLRLDRFVRLNQRHRITLAYDTVAGASSAGGVVLDLLPAMKQFDPQYIGFHWDTGHMALHGDGMWETLMRLAGPYVVAVGWRDRGWVQDLGLKGEGGPYAGPYPRVEPLVTQPDGSAVPGAPGSAGRGNSGLPGGRGRGGGRGGGGGGRAGGAANEEGGPAARGRGGPANSAGAGSIDADNPLYRSMEGEMPKRPIGGKNAKGGGWTAPDVAMGTGIVHIPHVASVLAEIGFNGPSELQSEYSTLAGAQTGADTITMSRQYVIGMLKRDVITIRKSFQMANCGLEI